MMKRVSVNHRFCRIAANLATASGFTMMDMIVTVSVIGILSSVSYSASIVEWRREQANAAAMEFSAWLEPISRTPDVTGQPCTVTLTTGSSRAPGSPLATVSPASCSTQPTLRLPEINQNTDYSVGASATSWSFTPRGSITTGSGATASSSNIDISIRFSMEGNLPVRCVRLSGTLGLLRFGSNNATGNTASECTNWSRS